MQRKPDAVRVHAAEAATDEDVLLHAFFGPLFDLPVGLVVIDAKASIRVFNAMAGYLLGISPSLVLGKAIGDVLPGATLPGILETGTPYYDKRELVNHRILRCSFIPVKLGPRVAFAAQFMQDQSEEIRLESQLSELRAKYDTLDNLLDKSFEELGAVDRDGQLIYLTRKSARNMGYFREQVIGKDITSIYPSCLLKKVSQTGIPEVAQISRQGKKKVPVVVMPILTDGSVEGAVCKSIFTDLHEAKEFIGQFRGLDSRFSREAAPQRTAAAGVTFDDIVGRSKSILAAKVKAARSAKGDSNILITGETGTGKELFARAIHSASMRRNAPFIVVNCAAIPDTLLESELFGYEDGSFTGARKGGKPGKFELAHNGTLFLDECADMSIGMQAKLLRAIQEKEFERVGGTVTYQVDVRILAATNKDLWDMVQQGQFREDLYYRLDVVNIHVPPLRSRMEDLSDLAHHFIPLIRTVTNSSVRGLTDEVLDLFMKYQWPGNIRELSNVLEGAMNFNTGELITLAALPSRLRKKMQDPRFAELDDLRDAVPQVRDKETVEKAMIEHAIRATKGNKRQTAKMLNISRATLYNKLRKYGIEHQDALRI